MSDEACFNSQRDGILLVFIRLPFFTIGFQLPTGWNSTLALQFCCLLFWRCFNSQRDGILLYCRQVFLDHSNSFNSQRDGILRDLAEIMDSFSAGFNSQRDGILLKLFWSFFEFLWFQFPTGWNSTSFLDIQRLCNGCFNSQRDGILPKLGGISTRASGVSIPNGMEFYKVKTYVRLKSAFCFNSQRDGILRFMTFTSIT